jgi:hypothetical protein
MSFIVQCPKGMVAIPSLEPGVVFGGRYEIVSPLGRGGHGVVFHAREVDGGREVALKVMLPSEEKGAAARFRRETSLVQRLSHPNTVRLYDVGATAEGVPYMVFELLRGRSLEVEIARGPMPPARVAALGKQILESLVEAHELGIVHRDIKPSNVMLVAAPGQPEIVKVLDFGVARPMASSERRSSITSDGQIIGSAPYTAPEQVRGERADARADVYAVGLLLAEALSGKPVYTGESEVLIWLMHVSPSPVPLPAAAARAPLGPLIVRAVDKDPAKRFPSAAEMLEELERLAPSPDRAPRRGAAERTPRARSERLAMVVAAAVGAALAIAFVARYVARAPAEGPAAVASVDRAAPAWFADWERRAAATDWTRTAPPGRASNGGVDELTLELARGAQRAVVHLWSFPEREAAAATSRANAQRSSGCAVHQVGARVASVRVDGDEAAARRLLDALDRPTARGQ